MINVNSYGLNNYTTPKKPATPQRLNIYYYNDTHGNSDQIAGIIHSARQFKANNLQNNSSNFILSAGDNYSGADIKKNNFIVSMMQNIMGVDFSAIGNHEIDGGLQGFYEVAKNKKTQFIATNVILKTNDSSENIIKKSAIKEQNGVKYGFIGAMPIDFKTCSKKENQKDISVMDFDQSIQAMQEEINKLKTEFVGTKELKDAKDKLTGQFVIALETNLDKAVTAGWFETAPEGYKFMKEYDELINSVNESDIMRVANRYFNNRYVLSAVKK